MDTLNTNREKTEESSWPGNDPTLIFIGEITHSLPFQTRLEQNASTYEGLAKPVCNKCFCTKT